ncbi:MAG: DUF4255 domain-containing protein [Crocinitomicaceae bacterium]|nr:DUF4255 domain-containing protein [Crocinitomicaceae bacterium]
MISQTIKKIVEDLNIYVNFKRNKLNPLKDYVVLKHIGKTMPNITADEKIFVNLINIEEDVVYKNQMAANQIGTNSVITGSYSMRVNLYVLFAFHPGDSNGEYSDALKLLTDVLRYFQGKRNMEVHFPPEPPYIMDVNYHNISLEDSYNLWSNMGGEQKPYAIFQFRLLEILPESDTLQVSGMIEEPVLTINPIPDNN